MSTEYDVESGVGKQMNQFKCPKCGYVTWTLTGAAYCLFSVMSFGELEDEQEITDDYERGNTEYSCSNCGHSTEDIKEFLPSEPSDTEFQVSDWQREVVNDTTRLGYSDWLAGKCNKR